MSFVTFVLLRTMFNLTVSLGGNLTQGRGLQRRRLSSFRFVRRGNIFLSNVGKKNIFIICWDQVNRNKKKKQKF